METAKTQARKMSAIRASGATVQIEPGDFLELVGRIDKPLVVTARDKSFLSGVFQYLASYKGLAFFAESKEKLYLPDNVEVIEAQRMWIPNL